jgi:hypothetical protein
LRDHALSRVESQELVDDDLWEELIKCWKFAMKCGSKHKIAQDADPANERVIPGGLSITAQTPR